jgi:O-antigen/teichoic acid export membrane protein
VPFSHFHIFKLTHLTRQATFFRPLFLLLLLNAVVKPVWIFGIDRQVQVQTGALAFGQYFALYNLSLIFAFLLDAGLSVYFNQSLASRQQPPPPAALLRIKLILALLYAALLALIALFSGINDTITLALLGINHFLFSAFVLLRSHITALQRFTADAWLSVLDKILMILVCGALLYQPGWFGPISIRAFILVQMMAVGCSILVAIFLLIRHKQLAVYFTRTPFNPQILKAALPFAITIFLMGLHSRADAFLLERLHPNGAAEAGIYASAYRLLDAANIVGFLLAGFLMPFTARHWPDAALVQDVALKSRNLLLSFTTILVTITIALAPWIYQLLYRQPDANGIAVLRYCIPVLISYAFVHIYSTLLTATGRIGDLLKITLVAALLNLLLNALLAPRYGAIGCCIAALVTQGIYAIWLMLHCKIKMGISLQPVPLLKLLLLAALLWAMIWAGGQWGVADAYLLALSLFAAIVYVLAMGIFSPRDVVQLLRKA